MGVVEQGLDESRLWFELLVESGIVPQTRLASLDREAEDLLKIVVSSIKGTRAQRPAK